MHLQIVHSLQVYSYFEVRTLFIQHVR